MPTYDFKCTHEGCDHTWEQFLSIKADNPDECPKCKNKNCVERLISSGSNFILVGNGWARDSYSK